MRGRGPVSFRLRACARLQFVVRTFGPGWRPGVLPRVSVKAGRLAGLRRGGKTPYIVVDEVTHERQEGGHDASTANVKRPDGRGCRATDPQISAWALSNAQTSSKPMRRFISAKG
jgi:hypothetical protein